MSLPNDLDTFHTLLQHRIRNQDALDGIRDKMNRLGYRNMKNSDKKEIRKRHVVGQTGCFCLDCLLHRNQEWRIGNVNTSIAGPRDCFREYVWGNSERNALGVVDPVKSLNEPTLLQSIRETTTVQDVKMRTYLVERDAKLINVCTSRIDCLYSDIHSRLFRGSITL